MTTRRTSRRIANLGLAAAVLMIVASSATSAAAACRPLPRSVIGWWPGQNNANDLTTFAGHGSLINGTGFMPGVLGNAFSFDGINDRVEVPDTATLRPAQFTLAAWILVSTAPAQNWSCIICKQFGSGTLDSYSLWMNFGRLQGGRFGFSEAVSPNLIQPGRLYHTAVAYDGATIRLYEDGNLVATGSGSGAISYDTNPVLIGAEDNGVNSYQAFIKGMIDEPMIFNRALSACEIRALSRAREGVSFCTGDPDGDLVPDFQDNCPATPNVAQTDTDGDGAGDLCDCGPTNAGVRTSPIELNEVRAVTREEFDWCRDQEFNGADTVYDIIRGELDDLPVTGSLATCRSRCTPPLTGLAGWWPGNGTGADLSGGHPGTLENGVLFGKGLTLNAFNFDGVNDRVRTAANVTLGNNFSVAAWVNSDVINQGSYHRIIENAFATGFYLGTDVSGAAYKFIVKHSVAPYGAANGGAIVPGAWQFVVGTYDGATGRLYVDGKQVASDTFTAPGTVSLPMNIGAHYLGGFGWKGRIDEVQVYGRTLSAAEVRALWEAGSAGECKAGFGGTDAQWTAPWAPDGAIPGPNQGFWYLYRGRNSCGSGTYGNTSAGAPRISTVCD